MLNRTQRTYEYDCTNTNCHFIFTICVYPDMSFPTLGPKNVCESNAYIEVPTLNTKRVMQSIKACKFVEFQPCSNLLRIMICPPHPETVRTNVVRAIH